MKEEYQLPFNEINTNPGSSIQSFQKEPNPIILLLDGLADARNLGAILRLSDAARISKVYTYQTHDVNTSKLEKVSRQTTSHIPIINLKDISEVAQLVKEFKPICLEYTNKSIPYTNYKSNTPCMLIIGNERRGVSEELLAISTSSLHIPMLGKNSSMNVSVATGIVVYHLLENMEKV